MAIQSILGALLNRLTSTMRWLIDRTPLTWRGFWLLSLGTLFLYSYGVLLKDWILLILGAIALGLGLLSVLSVLLSAFLFWRWVGSTRVGEEAKQPLYAFTGDLISTGFLLPSWQIPLADIQLQWLEPAAEVTLTRGFSHLEEQVMFPRRCISQEIVRRIVVRDLFGLAEVRWIRRTPRNVQILPRSASASTVHIQSLTDGEGRFVPSSPRRGDLVDTRAYMPGDPIRHIHWKLFARSNELIVRIPEPSRDYERKLVSYLICDPFDHYAAEIARWSLESGALGTHWVFGADGCLGFAERDLARAREMLAYSGRSEDIQGRDLERFLQSVDFQADQHLLLLFASGSIWRWLPAVREVLSRYPNRCSLIVADDRSQESQEGTQEIEPAALVKAESRWLRLFLLPKPEDEPSSPSALQELKALAQSGVDLRFVARPQGIHH